MGVEQTATPTAEPEVLTLTGEEAQQLSAVLDEIIAGLDETIGLLDRLHETFEKAIAAWRGEDVAQEATHAAR